MDTGFVAYYRVSTQEQGRSGLGLEAQQDIVRRFAGQGKIIQEFREIESGRNTARPVLKQAIAVAKSHEATLLIAKVDRLARNAAFVLALRDSGISFVCCDVPDMNPLSLSLLAVLAENEAATIRQRIRDALAAKRRRGEMLGNPKNLTADGRKLGPLKRKDIAKGNPRNQRAYALASELRANGLSYKKIADRLNESGFESPANKRFYASSARNLFLLYQKGQ